MGDTPVECLAGLSKLSGLQKLFVHNTRIENQQTQQIAGLINLTELDLSGNNIR